MNKEIFKIYNKGAYNILTEILRDASETDNKNLLVIIADVRAELKKMIDNNSEVEEVLLHYEDS